MLTLANWNLERALPKKRRAEQITTIINERAADIWILTETHKDIGPMHSNVITSKISPNGECWTSICSQFPITPLMEYVSDKERCTAARINHSKYGELIIYATVLPWVGSSWNSQPWHKGEAFISALTLYRQDWKKLQLAYPEAIHIIAGDFNQSLVDKHYYGSQKIRTKLEQTMEECNMKILTAGENDPVSRETTNHACIDHICISESRFEHIYSTKRWPEQNTPDKKLSDHFGIIVEVECKLKK